ncbi:MAG: hypothetical protein MJZ35_00020 [Bacteroidaceae bacterium]|nr:hypothetical protein [Bacteroidaceae bacterium]
MYYTKVIENTKENLNEINKRLNWFNRDTFFSAIASVQFDKYDIESLTCEIKAFIPLVEFEHRVIKNMASDYISEYTTPYNEFFTEGYIFWEKAEKSLAVFKKLSSVFEQVNKKGRCKNAAPGVGPLKSFEHSWLFCQHYTPDAFNDEGYSPCVYELFEAIDKCVQYIESATQYCKNMVDAVEDRRANREACKASLENYYRTASKYDDFSLSYDINGQIKMPDSAMNFVNEWKRAKDKLHFASVYYHNCSVWDGIALSCYIQQENKRLQGYDEEFVELYGNDPQHLNAIQMVVKGIENIFDITGKKVPSRYVYAVVTWAKPCSYTTQYLERCLNHFKKTYADNGGEKSVINLRALQTVHGSHDESELAADHKKINNFLIRNHIQSGRIS